MSSLSDDNVSSSENSQKVKDIINTAKISKIEKSGNIIEDE